MRNLLGSGSRVRRLSFALLAGIIAAAAVLTAAVAFPAPRSALVRLAVAAYLSTKGFHVEHLDLSMERGVLEARNIAVTDRGLPFFSSDRVRIEYGARDRALGISTVEVERPHIIARREQDGSYNLSRLMGGGGGSKAGGAPLRLTLRVHDGLIDVVNPYSPAAPGRTITLRNLEFNASIAQGRVSEGTASMVLAAGKRMSRVESHFKENDVSRVATATIAARNAPLAPVVDLLVSSNAFVVQDGAADLSVRAYAAGWDDASGPQWHLIGHGNVRDGKLRTLPFAVPIRDVNGALSVFDGTLEFPSLTAQSAGIPITAAGSVELFPAQQLGLRLSASGSLGRVARWLPFSATLPLSGPVNVGAAIEGPPANPHVNFALYSVRTLHYARVTIDMFRAHGYYHDGHVALRDTYASYAGASLYGYGDIDLTASPAAGQFVALLRAPSSHVPWVADVNTKGTTNATAVLSGPLMKLGGSGFAMTKGGDQRLRAEVVATPDRLTVETVLQDARGGELVGSTTFDRTGDHGTIGDAYARNYAMRSNGRLVSLKGVTRSPIGLPQAAATVSGYGVLRGSADAPLASVRLSARHVRVAGREIGRVIVGAAGSAQAFRIQRLAVEGPNASMEADGVARLRGSGRHVGVAGFLEGTARANLRSAGLPAGARGNADATFAAALDDKNWLAAVDASGARVSVAGVPLTELRAIVGASGSRINVYGASARAAGGSIDAQGTLPGLTQRGSLSVAARGVDLGRLRGPSLPLSHGVIVGVAHIGGTASAPFVSGAAALSSGDYSGSAISGDTQADYHGGTLRVHGGRVVTAGSVASIDGTIAGLSSGAPTMSLDITVPEGNLGALESAFSPGAVPLSGVASARLHAGGSLAQPNVTGNVDAGTGTVRGVTFNDMRASFAAAPGAIDVSSASVRFGSSRIALAGTFVGGDARLRASSPHVNLDDFNDFFNGRDALEGHGAIDLTVATSPARSSAAGFVRMRDSRISGIPVGSIEGRFQPGRRGALAVIHSRGPIASSATTIEIVPHGNELPQIYADAVVNDLNLQELAPYVRAEDQGISGIASAHVHAWGRARDFRGDMSFAVQHGRIHGTDIVDARGQLSVDPHALTVHAARVAIDGAAVTGNGRIDRNGRLQAHATADVRDLHALEHFSRRPISMNGPMVANVDAAGTIARPSLHARVRASLGQVQQVAYDDVAADATYDRGRVTAHSNVTLADGHGNVRLAAELPIQTRPFRIGPNDRVVKLYGAATGVGIASLNPLLGSNVTSTGTLDGRFAVLGTAGKPRVAGDVHLRGVTVQSRFDKVPLTDLNADVALAQDSIEVSKLHANAGSGTVDAGGNAHIVPATALRPAASLQYAFNTSLRGAQVDVPNYLRGTVDANLGLTKSGTIPYLFGDVTFQHSSVPFASILALASGHGAGPANPATIPGLPPMQPRHVIVYGGSVFGDDLDHVVRPTPRPVPHPAELAIVPQAVDLGVRVIAAKDVGVTGLLNVTGTGEVDVAGDTTAPSLSGTLTAVRGRAGFLNTSFDLLDGFLTFQPQEGLIPSVSADAVTRTEDADITVSVYGRVDQLHTDLASDPEMAREAIIATLLRIPQLNSALASSHGQQQAALGVSPQNLVSGAVAGQILGALNIGLEQVLNLEEISFALDPLGRPSLEVRKQVSPRAYTLYRTTFTVPPAQALGIAYQVRRRLQMEFTQSQTTPGALASYAVPQTSFSVRVTFH